MATKKTAAKPDGVGDGKPEVSYTKAFKELQKIVDELESEEVEIDALVSRLQRAGTLLQICKSRLSATEAETEKLLAKIVE